MNKASSNNPPETMPMEHLHPAFQKMVANSYDPDVVEHMVYTQVPMYCKLAQIPVSFLSDLIHGAQARNLAFQNTLDCMMGVGPERFPHHFSYINEFFLKAKENLTSLPAFQLRARVGKLRGQLVAICDAVFEDMAENVSMRVNPKLEAEFGKAYSAARRRQYRTRGSSCQGVRTVVE